MGKEIQVVYKGDLKQHVDRFIKGRVYPAILHAYGLNLIDELGSNHLFTAGDERHPVHWKHNFDVFVSTEITIDLDI